MDSEAVEAAGKRAVELARACRLQLWQQNGHLWMCDPDTRKHWCLRCGNEGAITVRSDELERCGGTACVGSRVRDGQ